VLLEWSETIQQGCGWDSVSIRELSGLIRFLEDEEFLYFLDFFNRLMLLIDTFHNILQKEITTVVSVRRHLQKFCYAIGDIREELTHMPFEDSETSNAPQNRKRNTNKTACGIECCDIIIK
jgi:hypothetical protein